MRDAIRFVALAAFLSSPGCGNGNSSAVRATGYVEATEVRLAAEVGGRVLEVAVEEGARVSQGAVIARLDATDLRLARDRGLAERAQAEAQLRLLEAGSRPEEIRQAEAQLAAAEADTAAARAEYQAAAADLERFEGLLAANAGSRKQRDDAATRREQATARMQATEERARAARESLARLRAGARRQEIEAARARLAAADAQIATFEKQIADATLVTPVSGVVTSRLVDPGEMVAPRTPVVIITDLDRAWANVYVEEPYVPRLTLGEVVTILTDAGDRLQGTVTFISPRAEFTPRNVQTASDRAKLVYRVKVMVDNRDGVLKPGMPIEAEFTLE